MFYALKLGGLDFQNIVKEMDIKIDLVYTINIFTLNYESFVPL